jgi:hypothetical protein
MVNVEDSVRDLFDSALALCGVSTDDYMRIMELTNQREIFEYSRNAGHATYDTLRASPPCPSTIDASILREIQDSISQFFTMTNSAASKRFSGNIVPALWLHLNNRARDLWLVPHFARAVEDTTVSAWIGANDSTAAAALEFLDARGIRVPGDISVFGFDNTPEAFAMDLSTYNFNMRRIASSMFSYIRGPAKFRAVFPVGTMEVEGETIERLTSGKPGNRGPNIRHGTPA